jgi:competence protein ComGC
MNNNQGKALVTIIIIVLLCAILLAVTNPDKNSHIQAIKDHFSSKNTVSSMLAQGIMTVNPPSYHNAALISYTKHDGKISTIGIIGYVWVDKNVLK